MLPATFCAGMTLPLITRTLLADGSGERAIGAVYAWNTLGSIVGVMLGGLVLLPVIGLKAMLIAGARDRHGDRRCCSLVPGAWTAEGRRLAPVAAFATVRGGAVVGVGVQLDRNAALERRLPHRRCWWRRATARSRFYRDGRTATVTGPRTIGHRLALPRHQREARRLADPDLVHAVRLGSGTRCR